MTKQDHVLVVGGDSILVPLRSALEGAYRIEALSDVAGVGPCLSDASCAAVILHAAKGTSCLPSLPVAGVDLAVPVIVLADGPAEQAALLGQQIGAHESFGIEGVPWPYIAGTVRRAIHMHHLLRENALLRQVIEHASDCVLAVDSGQAITLVNNAVTQVFGYPAADIYGKPVSVLFPGERARSLAAEMLDALKGGSAWAGEVSAQRRDGSSFPVHVSLSFERDGAGNVRSAILNVRDVTDQQRLLERLKQLSITDDLTGAYNARYLWARLRYEFLRARRYGQPLCCLMADLDRFKLVNDTYGHRVGDEVLRLVARTMHDVIRGVDIVARYGGEEFAVILPNTMTDGALQCAEHLRRSVEQASLTVAGQILRVTVSLGVATLTPDVEDEEELLRRADNALILAKRRGRNRVCLWSAEDPELATDRSAKHKAS